MYHCYYNTGQAGMKGAKGEAGVTGPAGYPGATSGYGKQSAPGKCLCYLGSITALLFTINFKTTCHTHIKSLYLFVCLYFKIFIVCYNFDKILLCAFDLFTTHLHSI